MRPRLLVATVIFFCFTSPAYAATAFTIGSLPESTVVYSGKTEKIGTIQFTTAMGAGATVAGTITIDYLNPISANDLANVIQDLTASDGLTPPTIGTPTIVDMTKLVFTITPSPTTPSLDYYFRVTGVRVDVASAP